MAAKKKKRRRRRNDMLVLRLLVLVVLVLVVFEGKMVRTMFTQGGGSQAITAVDEQEEPITEIEEIPAEPVDTVSENGHSSILAGPDLSGSPDGQTQDETQAPTPDFPESAKIVSAQSASVDDSYFTDAVFIGDSRMAGFQNASGITQGAFLTGVGMSVDQFSKAKVQTTDGTVTVYQGLSGKQYKKIYIMLGANDLGFYPWDDFKPAVEQILQQIHQLQPSAVIYFCSCIYVEESKVTTSYVNNANVQLVNDYLLQACEDLSYAYYVNLNEIFDNGYHSLLDGASQDGVHLYEKYLKQMLEYLRTHYLSDADIEAIAAAAPAVTVTTETAADTSTQAETQSGQLVGSAG